MFGFEHQARLMLAFTDAAFGATAALTRTMMAATEQSMAACLALPTPAPTGETTVRQRPKDRSSRAVSPMSASRRPVRSWYRNPTTPTLFEPMSWMTAAAWSAANSGPWWAGFPAMVGAAAGRNAADAAEAFNPFRAFLANASEAKSAAPSSATFVPLPWELFGPLPFNAWMAPAAWLGSVAGRSSEQRPPHQAAPDADPAYSAYRSDGGHAVAQVRFSTDAMTAGLPDTWAAMMTLPAFAPWISRRVH